MTFLRSLRVQVLGLLLLAFIPIAVMIVVQASFDVEAESEMIRAKMQNSAVSVIDLARDQIDDTTLLLQTSNTDLKASQGCKSVKDSVSSRYPIVTNILVIDQNGLITCSAIGAEQVPMDNLEWLDPFKAGEQIFVTNAFYGSQSKRWIFAVLVRSEIDSDRYEIHAAGIDGTQLVQGVSNSLERPGLLVGLIDESGKVFGDDRFEGADVETLKQNAFSDDFFRLNISDKFYDVSTVDVGPDNLRVILARPVPSSLSILISRPARNIAIPFLALLSAVLATWWAIDTLALKWLRRLKRVVNIYAGGRYTLSDDETMEKAPYEISALAAGLDVMSNRIAERENRLEEVLEQRNDAIREVHHRVKNNLQIVSSFINLEARATASDEAKAVLGKARSRVAALSIVHQTLYQYERLEQVEIEAFLNVLLDHLSSALGVEDAGVTIERQIENAVIASDDAIPLALVVLELVTNSMKYAFGEGGGTIKVSFREAPETFTLIVADTGCGDGGSGHAESTGLGSKLLVAFARQLQGDLREQTEGGRTTTLTFPNKIEPQSGT